MKKVTSKQMERLYEFTHQHYVEYYDVQAELVDHLANAIETHWQTAPNDDFETILQKEFRKFGVFGFMNIVEEKTNQMNRRYNRILWENIKTFFSFPKIILTLLLAVLTYSLLLLFEDKGVVILTLNSITIATIIILSFRNRKLYYQKSGKKWLFEDIIFRLNYYNWLFALIFQFNFQFVKYIPNSSIVLWTYSILFAIFLIFIYLVTLHFPKSTEKYLTEIYPEYKLV